MCSGNIIAATPMVLESANLQPNLYDFLEGAVIDVAL